MCHNCPNRPNCKKICKEVEAILNGLNYGPKTNYLVKFINPHILEEITSRQCYSEKPTIQRFRMYRVLDKKLRYLSKLQRICICYYYGFRGKESLTQVKIGKMLGISQPAVKAHLSRAKLVLKARMGKYFKK